MSLERGKPGRELNGCDAEVEIELENYSLNLKWRRCAVLHATFQQLVVMRMWLFNHISQNPDVHLARQQLRAQHEL